MSVEKLITGSNAQTKWLPALSNEWGRLAQGNNAGVPFTDTIEFTPYSEVPTDSKVTYASFACDG